MFALSNVYCCEIDKMFHCILTQGFRNIIPLNADPKPTNKKATFKSTSVPLVFYLV